MLRFRQYLQYLSEGINTKKIKVPQPDIDEDDGYEVYTYPTGHDILQVGISPHEDGAHHVWFTHGGSFSRAMDTHTGTTVVPKDTGFTMRVLSHVAATLKHHSKKNKATDYTYETASKTRHNIYQRIAKAAGVVARNLTPPHHMFNRHEPVENWPSNMRPERLDEDMPVLDDDYDDSTHHQLHANRLFDLGYKRLQTYELVSGKPKHIGSIGPYNIFHTRVEKTSSRPNVPGSIYHHFTVHHGETPIGYVSFNQRADGPDGKEWEAYLHPADLPRFKREHSGTRSSIHALPAKVYAMAAKHLKLPIVSGEMQSRGGINIWKNLAGLRGGVRAVHDRSGEQFQFNPHDPKHIEMAYDHRGLSGKL